MTPRIKYQELVKHHLHFDKHSGRYRWQNPVTRERHWFGRDREVALERAKRANAAALLQAEAMKDVTPESMTLDYVTRRFLELEVPNMPWSDSTRRNHIRAFRLYQLEIGHILFHALDRVVLNDWITRRCTTADCRNKHRMRFVLLWKFAIARKWTNFNEAEAIPERSNSLKIEANRKVRTRLNVEDFWRIHEAAPPFLQIAMELSLVTLQARNELCLARYSDIQDGQWRFIRQKTAGTTDMAFFKITMTPQIESIIARSRDTIVSPMIVHYRPASVRPQHQANKEHWTQVTPDYLTKTFKASRDSVGVGQDLEPRARPTFHEIRSLGGRIYRELGYPEEYVRALYAHTDHRATQIYLSDPERLHDSHFRRVEAALSLINLPAI